MAQLSNSFVKSSLLVTLIVAYTCVAGLHDEGLMVGKWSREGVADVALWDHHGKYSVDIAFRGVPCESPSIDRRYVSKTPQVLDLIDKYLGPEEVLLEVNGLSLQSFLPSYSGCGRYVQTFTVPESGAYNLKIVRLRSNYTGVLEAPRLYYPAMLDIVLRDWVWLNTSSHSHIHNKADCGDGGYAQGMWMHIPDNLAYTKGVFSSLSLARATTPTPYARREKALEGSSSSNMGMVILPDAFTLEVNVSSTATMPHCASAAPLRLDQYEWRSSNPHCPLPAMDATRAADIIRNRKIALVGDSHARVLAYDLWHVICDAHGHSDYAFKYPVFDADISTGKNCTAMWTLRYEPLHVCDRPIPPSYLGFDVVVINCGHHLLADRRPETMDKAASMIDRWVGDALRAGYRPSQLVWLESNPQPLRQDAWFADYADARTLSRLKLLNLVAAKVVSRYRIPILPTFDALLVWADKQCDVAHYTAIGATAPIVRQAFHLIDQLTKKGP